MRMSIFEIENRLNINKEFIKFSNCLFEASTISYNYNLMTLHRFLNTYVFNLWEHRDTFIDFDSYLEHIGIDYNALKCYTPITEESFLNFLELMLNLMTIVKKNFENKNVAFKFLSAKVESVVKHNIPLILEKMNYVSYQDGDKFLIRKRDADVDSILELVPEDIQTLLLSYNDIRNNSIESKKTILKKIDLFIEKRKGDYKSFNAPTYDTIQIIVNKMGINHPLKEKGYVDMTNDELIIWYDKCFKLMIHLIRTEEVNKINDERKQINLQ